MAVKTFTKVVATQPQTNAETVVAIVNAPSLDTGNVAWPGIELDGYVNITLGTSSTALVVKVRQGSTVGGAQVGTTDTHTIAAASSPVSIPFSKSDLSGVEQTQYCLTLTQTSGGANGTVNDFILKAELAAF